MYQNVWSSIIYKLCEKQSMQKWNLDLLWNVMWIVWARLAKRSHKFLQLMLERIRVAAWISSFILSRHWIVCFSTALRVRSALANFNPKYDSMLKCNVRVFRQLVKWSYCLNEHPETAAKLVGWPIFTSTQPFVYN